MKLYQDQHRILHELMAYISSNLDKRLTLNDLSRVCGYSRFHLGRIFEAHMGMSLGQYVRLQKLGSGMMQIVISKKGLLEIALENGYESHASFTKEFKKLFGVSPGKFVENSIKMRDRFMKENSKIITPEFVGIRNHDNYEIGYIRKTGSYFRSAPEAWSELAAELFRVGKTLGECERFGISHDNPHEEGVDEEQMRFDACVNLCGLSDRINLDRSLIKSGTVAIFIHKGPLERLGESFHYIYGHWIATKGVTLRSAPPFCRYQGVKPKNQFDQVAEINIPIEPF